MRFTGYSSYRLQIITAKNYINKNTEPKKAWSGRWDICGAALVAIIQPTDA